MLKLKALPNVSEEGLNSIGPCVSTDKGLAKEAGVTHPGWFNRSMALREDIFKTCMRFVMSDEEAVRQA